jgi:hypothetical protein
LATPESEGERTVAVVPSWSGSSVLIAISARASSVSVI